MIGYIAGALTTIAFAPQLLQALTTKSTKDVSIMMLLCSTSGMVLAVSWNSGERSRTHCCKQHFRCTCFLASGAQN